MGSYDVIEVLPADLRRIFVKGFLLGIGVGIVAGGIWHEEVKMLLHALGNMLTEI